MRLLLFILLNYVPYAVCQDRLETTELKASLISNCDSIPKNGEASIGVLFDLKPGWHLYWINPGDAGLAPKIQWRIPNTIIKSETQWAFPHAMELDGIHNLGYADQLLLPITLQTKEINQQAVEIIAETNWLVCKDICIPGKAELKKIMPVTEACQTNPHTTTFSKWQEKIPKKSELLGGSVLKIDKKIQLEIYFKQPVFKQATSVEVFIENPQVVSYQATQTQQWKNNWLVWKQEINDAYSKMPETLYAVIVIDHQKSYRITLSTTEENTP